jgi:hypothetical protein
LATTHFIDRELGRDEVEFTEKFIKRFWSKVNIKGEDDCWEWTGCLNNIGYGRIRYNDITLLTHKVSYIIHFGWIPYEQCILHKCDNRKCINPNHLWCGTKKENMIDASIKGRMASGENQGKRQT